jgi:hypothetical protein
MSTPITLSRLFFAGIVLGMIPGANAVPPLVLCSSNQTVACVDSNGAPAVVTATVQDPDGDPLLAIWAVNGRPVLTNLVARGGSSNLTVLTLSRNFAGGTNDVRVGVTDGGRPIVQCATQVIVRDLTPPVLHGLSVAPRVLWPPNHRIVPLQFGVRATDDCGPVRWRVKSIRSSESVFETGSGHTAPDWQIVGPQRAWVRAERSGRGPGRTYTIEIEVRDRSGNRHQRDG